MVVFLGNAGRGFRRLDEAVIPWPWRAIEFSTWALSRRRARHYLWRPRKTTELTHPVSLYEKSYGQIQTLTLYLSHAPRTFDVRLVLPLGRGPVCGGRLNVGRFPCSSFTVPSVHFPLIFPPAPKASDAPLQGEERPDA